MNSSGSPKNWGGGGGGVRERGSLPSSSANYVGLQVLTLIIIDYIISVNSHNRLIIGLHFTA